MNSISKSKGLLKHDYEILFNDSADYFIAENAKMTQEGSLIRFICFDENGEFKEDVWYPMVGIHRIKRYRIQ